MIRAPVSVVFVIKISLNLSLVRCVAFLKHLCILLIKCGGYTRRSYYKIEEQRKEIIGEPKNFEEQIISLAGSDIYEKFIKGYTEKQWRRDCKELPAFIIKRLNFDSNYFNTLYQGISIGGYIKIIVNLLDGIEVRLNTDYLENKVELDAVAKKVVYTGPIDAYSGYKLGTLEYRSVCFLKQKFWISRIFKVIQRSIILIVKLLGLELLNTSGLSLVRMRVAMSCRKQLSSMNTVANGNREMNHIIQ